MTRLRVVSDLHLESIPYPDRFTIHDKEFDILVAAGDILRSRPGEAAAIVAKLAGGKPSVMVLGNHEPWGRNIREVRDEAAKACRDFGVTLLDDDEAEVAGIRFVGGTLWTDGRLGRFIEEYPNGRTGEDIRVGDDNRTWTITDAAAAFRATLAAIETAMNADGSKPIVVVTHHAPLEDCLHPGSRGKPISGLVASDLSAHVDRGKAALWIHGHLHHSVDILRPGGTRVICNPAGTRFSNATFDETLTVEV